MTGVLPIPWGVATLAGGGRSTLNLTRARYEPIATDDSRNCPFDLPRSTGSSWRTLTPNNTPFEQHVLVVPDTCWSEAELRSLGSIEGLTCAFVEIASGVSGSGAIWAGIHIGRSAGQSMRHAHWHVVSPQHLDHDTRLLPGKPDPGLIVAETDDYAVWAGGLRAGQLVAAPRLPVHLHTVDGTKTIVTAVDYMVNVAGASLARSAEEPCDFVVGLSLTGTHFHYATYVPILNSWGFTEYLGLAEGAGVVLPWPHATTAAHVRSSVSC